MIYLDHNATTPLSPAVKKCIHDNEDLFYNPSSLYEQSDLIKRKILDARKSVAQLINAAADNIVFTGCATESNNTVFNSCVDNTRGSKHIIVSSVEHSAVLATANYYRTHRDVDITIVPVDECGRIDVDTIVQSVREDTILVSIMLVNNEIGNCYPIKEIAELVHAKNPNTMVHTDAVQAIGKMNVDVIDLGVDFLSISGHKFYAPKGVGALFVKDHSRFLPFMRGGHQENGYRAGTENFLSITAMGIAAKETIAFTDYSAILALRDYMETRVLRQVRGSRVLGDINNRVCNTSCILIDDFSGINICEAINRVGGVCISSGSACNSIELKPSHVMLAMGINSVPIRISLGKNTTKEDIDNFCRSLLLALNILRKK